MERALMFDTVEIAREWFEIGKQQNGTDPSQLAIRFIAFWIAFNGRYAKEEGVNERDQIDHFMEKKGEELAQLFDFDNQQRLEVFRSAPVFSKGRSPQDTKDYLSGKIEEYDHGLRDRITRYRTFMNPAAVPKNRMKALIFTIYEVRCNMFHGGKTPRPDRNYDLVDSSQWVLEQILNKLGEKR